MKIISKYRDYYDHLVSHYGFDETRVYDRRGEVLTDSLYDSRILISICGIYYPIVTKEKEIYFNADKSKLNYWENNFIQHYKGQKSFQNIKFRQPVLVRADKHIPHKNPLKKGEFVESYKIPILGNLKFPSIISANEMYEKIYDFLGWLKDNPEPPNTQTDKDKIVAHGFDTKRSFRPQIKD